MKLILIASILALPLNVVVEKVEYCQECKHWHTEEKCNVEGCECGTKETVPFNRGKLGDD